MSEIHNEKTKAIDPIITVELKTSAQFDGLKPYYSIRYFDLSDNKWHIGYGSFYLTNVQDWLKEHFDVVEADVAPVVYGKWNGWHGDKAVDEETQRKYRYYECSECHRRSAVKSRFCPNCGAKMDGGD